MANLFHNYINGQAQPSVSDQTFTSQNPAKTSESVGTFPVSHPDDVNQAVNAARKAFALWKKQPAPKRGELLRRIGDRLSDKKNTLAREMTREMGKPLTETKADVQEAVDTAYYAASECRRLFGRTVPSELPNKFNMSIRQPVGVCAIITAWNFPVAVPSWKLFPALAAGNTVVFKPSEESPKTAALLIQLLEEADLPPGVVNIIYGADQAGRALVQHPDINAIGFTGSTATGTQIAATAGRQNKRVSLEMGGKNPQIVMDDANLALALEGVLWGAFGTTGQRCTATSRLIVHKDVHDELVDRLTNQSRNLTLGNGLDDTTDVGPLINQAAREKVQQYVQWGQEEGATLRLGGTIPQDKPYQDGYFFEPTIFTEVTPGMRIEQEEIFGPVLSVIRADSYREAVEIANDTSYGLSSSIYTQNINLAYQAMHELEAGLTYINGPTIGAEAHMPFGGVKNTGNGHRDGGWEVFDFYTETKTIYVDFSGQLQKAQIDT